jgi:hypothetical protein
MGKGYPTGQRDIPHPWGVFNNFVLIECPPWEGDVSLQWGTSPCPEGYSPGQRDIPHQWGILKKMFNLNNSHRWGTSLWAGGYLTVQRDIPAPQCIGLDCNYKASCPDCTLYVYN